MAAPKKKQDGVRHLEMSAKLSAQNASEKLLASARAEALRLQRAGWEEDEIEDALKIHLGELSDGDISRLANMEINEAFSLGRVAAGDDFREQIEKVVYSAILDRNTCDACEKLDGEEFDVDSDAYDENMPPNANCEGGDNCRCVYLYVLSTDAEMREAALADWEEEKHPRDEHGRFGAGSSSQTPSESFYHGTTKDAVERIKKEGIRPESERKPGGDELAYATAYYEQAEVYAVQRARAEGKEPVIFELRVPNDIASAMGRDVGTVIAGSGFKPEWIQAVHVAVPRGTGDSGPKGYEKNWKRIKLSDKGRLVFAVVLPGDGETA